MFRPLDKEARIAQEKEVFANLDKFREDVEKYVLIYKGDIEDGAVLCGEVTGRIDDLTTVKELID